MSGSGGTARSRRRRSYAYSIALFLRWCERAGRPWSEGAGHLGSFMTWLRHAGPQALGSRALAAGRRSWPGPGQRRPGRPGRVNGVLTAVRGMVVHAAASGQAPGDLVPLLYEVADDRDLPGQARGDDGRMSWRLRARHRLREPETRVDRAFDEEIVALLKACLSARDRLAVLLMARAGLRCGELCGLRRSDVHLLADSRPLGCDVARAHLHVTRREDNPNGAWAKSRRQRAVPLDFLAVQAFDTYELERAGVAAAAGSDFVLVNLFRGTVGAPMRPGAVGELITAASSAGRPGPGRHAAPASPRLRVQPPGRGRRA